MILGFAMPAIAAPFDWRITRANDDDTIDYLTNVTTREASTSPALLGVHPTGQNGRWYYIKNDGFIRVDPAAPEQGSDNYEISLDLGGFNPLNIGNLNDLLNGKVGTTSLALSNGRITSLESFRNDMNSNFFGTSTTMTLAGSTTVNVLVPRADAIKLAALSTSSVTQVQSDWNQTNTASSSYIQNKPTVGRAYEGTTQRTGSFPVFKNATVASGVAVFHLTIDGTSGGTALFPNGIIADSIDVEVNDATASYQMSYALSNGNKTLTVTANKLTTANILTGLLGQAQANGSVVRLQAWGY